MSTASQSVSELIATCQAHADDIAQAFARAFDVSLEASVGLGTNWDSAASPDGFNGPGVAIVIHVEQQGLIAALPQTSGVLPEWVNRSDAGSKSRLETLAQELSLLLLPDSLPPGEYRTVWVDCLADAIERAAPVEGAARIPLVLRSGKEPRGTLSLIWPVRSPGQVAAA